MKKMLGVCIMIILSSYLFGCSKRGTSIDTTLSSKDTDERIIMCLEEVYPEHQFEVVVPYDKEVGYGIFKDDTGIEFKVRDIGYNNIYHFSCGDEYLYTILDRQNFSNKVHKIVRKYGQTVECDSDNIMISTVRDENNTITVSEMAEMVLEILNSVDVPKVINPENMTFSTGEVNYYTLPAWGVLEYYYEEDGIGVMDIFYYEDKDKEKRR